MKLHLCLIFLIIHSFSVIAQEDDEPMYYLHEINVDYGVMASMDTQLNHIIGNTYNFQTAYFYKVNTGFRVGLNLAKDFEGANSYYSIPLYFAYRTDIKRRLSPNIETCGDFLFSVLLLLFPNNLEFNIGPNFGYFTDETNLLRKSSDGGKTYYNEGFRLKNKFSFSLDAGLKGKLYIWRIALVGGVSIAYMPTRNFIFQSPNKDLNGFRPKIFGQATIGMAFNL